MELLLDAESQIETWQEVILVYNAALKQINTKLEILNDEFQHVHQYNPIEHIKSRIKTSESIVKKLRRHGYESTIENMVKYVNDIAGIRVICSFTSDIYRIAEMIRLQNDIHVIAVKDYIRLPKASGYKSYHMLVTVPVFLSDRTVDVKVEIQIRTLAMNFWAIIEHSLQYKYKENMPDEVRGRLLRAAKAVDALDMEMSSVRDEIMDAQNSNRRKAGIVSDILNNIENLYRTMNKREVGKIQDEFFRVYQADDIALLERFNRQLDVLSESYRAQSLN